MIRKEAYSHQVNFFECDFELVGVEQALMGQFWRIIDDDEDDDEDGDDDDVEQAVMDELRRIIEDSEIMAEDDELWPQPDRVGDDITNDKI